MHPAASQPRPQVALHVIATPIGNLGDLSPRAAHLLATVDLLLCEDTRHSGALLERAGARPERWSLNAHNELSRVPAADVTVNSVLNDFQRTLARR